MAETDVDALLDQLFRELDDGVCLSLSSGQLVYMNPAAARFLEVAPEDVRRRSICDVVCGRLMAPGVEDCLAECALRKRTGGRATFQGRYEPLPPPAGAQPPGPPVRRWKDLRVHCTRIQTLLFDSWEPDKRLTIIEDATAEMDLERHKEDWRNMIAHDLRNPLTNIFGTLRLLEDEADPSGSDPEMARMLSGAVGACRRMLELLNLYLDVAKLDVGLMAPRDEDVDLADLARRAADEQEVSARERGVVLSVHVPAGLRARADGILLSRVVQNLVGNALKFTPKGGRVELAARRASDGGVEIIVTDNGAGIPAEDFPRVFDRFYQSESRREGRTKGTGLGLTFCREAVMAMKGRIFVQSIPGLGTQFVVALPPR